MNNFDKQFNNRSGSALIIVVVMVVLLAIVGFTFVMIARLDAIGAGSLSKSQEMEAATKNLISQIAEVIADDVYSGQGQGYDYADPNNQWLASIEPYYYEPDDSVNINNKYRWQRISDVFGILEAEDINVTNVYADPKGWSDATNNSRELIDEYQTIYVAPVDDYEPENDADLMLEAPNAPDDDDSGNYLTGELLKGRQYDANDKGCEVGMFQGQWADADGDGVADSKWFAVPGMKTSDGQNYYAAVRIIDNSGMINVNTSYKDDRPDYDALDQHLFYGESQLSVNLGGVIHPGDDIDYLFEQRGAGLDGNDDLEWTTYKQEVVDRLSNLSKDENYKIFGISDELSLRNRFCINAGIDSRLEQILPDTLNGQWGSKARPFMGGEDGTFLEWAVAVTGGGTAVLTPVDPDVRHMLTVMSKSREITPVQIQAADLSDGMQVLEGRRKAYIKPVEQTVTVEGQSLEQLAGNIYYAIKDTDLTGRLGDYEVDGGSMTKEQMAVRSAWHFALNLIDYQYEDAGEDDLPSYARVNDKTYFGFEGIDALLDDTLIVSEYAYYKNTSPGDLSYNPALKPNRAYYMLEIYNPSPNAKEITLLNDYKITVIKEAGTVERTFSLYNDIFSATNTSIPADDTILIASDLGDSNDAFGIAADYEDSSLKFAQTDIVLVHKLDWPVTIVGDEVDMPVDRCSITLDLGDVATLVGAQRRDEFVEDSGLLMPAESDLRWESYIITPNTLGSPPVIRNTIDLDLEIANDDIFNIGEIENVFAVGAYSDSDVVNDIPFISAIEKSANKLGDSYPLKSWGRFDITDSDIQGLFNYLTAFNPSFDDLDTDNDLLTSDRPLNDLIDNDSDGTIDNAGEEEPRYYETLVHGRININTAPQQVLEQLPWAATDIDASELAASIVARRDGRELFDTDGNSITDYSDKSKGFKNIAQLIDVTYDSDTNYDIQTYVNDGVDLNDYPDFTDDELVDDYEERDILFQRVSNCITTESDIFTAYILLRAGAEGEQSRVAVIYDRSKVYEEGDMPKITIQQASLLGK
ncbi:MAG: hypothetical protein ACIAQZ_05880 [Sedimentisphaeraceae bacterium JB056]